MSSLEDKLLLLLPQIKLPLRKCYSAIDLQQIDDEDCVCRNRSQSFDYYGDDFQKATINPDQGVIRKLNSDSNCNVLKKKDENENTIKLKILWRKSCEEEHILEKTLDWNQVDRLSPNQRACLLIRSLSLNNPLFLAVQLTSIDKKLFLRLTTSEVIEVTLGKKNLAVSIFI